MTDRTTLFRAEVQWDRVSRPGALQYRRDDRSFLFLGMRMPIHGSILMNDLQLWIAPDGAVAAADGYAPMEAWQRTLASAPRATAGGLSFPGVAAVALDGQAIELEPRVWPVHENQAGWVVFGDERAEGDAVEFATGSIAVVDGGRFAALWLHPEHVTSSDAD